MCNNNRVRLENPIRKVALLAASCALVAFCAQAGSPLTLSILQDGSVKATVLDITYERNVHCKKPGSLPDVKIVTEQGTLKLGGKKSFYISELQLVGAKVDVCFMPAHTIKTSTGGETYTQDVAAETWGQIKQTVDIKKITALIGSVRFDVGSSCLGKGKLDTSKDHKVLKLSQAGSTVKKTVSGAKPGSAPEPISLDCQVTAQP